MTDLRDLSKTHALLHAWDVSDVDTNSVDGWICVTCGEQVATVLDRPERTPCCDACAQTIIETFRTRPLGIVPTDDECDRLKKFIAHTHRFQVPDTIRRIIPFLNRVLDGE